MVKNIMFIEKGSLDSNNHRKLLENLEKTNVNIVEYETSTTKPELVSIEINNNAEELKSHIINDTMDKILNALSEYIKERTAQYVDFDNLENRNIHRISYRGSRESFMADFVEFLNRG